MIGDTVNLASRLEGMTKELDCDVVLSEDLYRQVEEHVQAEPLRKIKVKGRDQEIMVYRLIGLRCSILDSRRRREHRLGSPLGPQKQRWAPRRAA